MYFTTVCVFIGATSKNLGTMAMFKFSAADICAAPCGRDNRRFVATVCQMSPHCVCN